MKMLLIALLAPPFLAPPILDDFPVTPASQSFESTHVCERETVHVRLRSAGSTISLMSPTAPSDSGERDQWGELVRRLESAGPLLDYRVICRANGQQLVIHGGCDRGAHRMSVFMIGVRNDRVTGYTDREPEGSLEHHAVQQGC